jgi:SAM-dependent methyltransferase
VDSKAKGPLQYDERLAPEAVRQRYQSQQAYDRSDPWHRFTAETIRREVSRIWGGLNLTPEAVVLNIGAGNNDLGVCPPSAIHLDISEAGLAAFERRIVASVEAIPIEDESVDIAICVGSVINYCDAAAAISEIARVIKPDGRLLIEFESSRSGEFAFQACFGRAAAVAETFYGDDPETVWVYTLDYVRSLLSARGLALTASTPIHIASPWMLLANLDVKRAASLGRFDRVLRHVPYLSRWASNFLLVCRKT